MAVAGRAPWRAVCVGLGAIVLSACSSTFLSSGGEVVDANNVDVVAQAVPAGTDPDDAIIGLREHPRIIANYGGEYKHRRTELMLNRIVKRLLIAANQPSNDFTVTILDTPQVNAFALPGGYIYVTRGIVALANDESELAAVLAHEIAHVTLRHARARSIRVRTSELVDKVITSVFGGDLETDQASARSRVSLAAFSQSQELEADVEGVLVAGKAGYDPHAAARFLASMARFADFAEKERQGDGDFLSTHPSTPDRIEKVVETARGFGAPGMGESNVEGYLASIDGITFGTSPSQGVIIGRKFIHPELRFLFSVPPNYKLQNGDGAVVGVASDGEAMRFDSAKVPEDLSLREYLGTGWIAGLDEASISEDEINGIDVAQAKAKTEKWVFRVAAFRLRGDVYRFIFAAREESDRFEAAVEQTVQSFASARRADLAQLRNIEVDIVRASARDNLETLIAKMQGLEQPQLVFDLLNNRLPDDPIVAGKSYKLVVVK